MKKRSKIILFGAGGHALSVIDVIEKTKKFKILFIVDKFEGFVGKYKVYKQNEEIDYYKKYSNRAFISIGQIKDSNPRKILYKKLIKNKYILPKIVSPYAYVSSSARIGNGSIIMHHALVNSYAEIGENCIVNSKTLIEHSARVENNCHLSTGSIINGDCYIKKDSFIGSNATIIQGVIIGEKSIIGAGQIIKKNLKSKSIYK
jgi:sugar O-acyltransferase (sialic acid O-acetyltransferase NeuD family)